MTDSLQKAIDEVRRYREAEEASTPDDTVTLTKAEYDALVAEIAEDAYEMMEKDWIKKYGNVSINEAILSLLPKETIYTHPEQAESRLDKLIEMTKAILPKERVMLKSIEKYWSIHRTNDRCLCADCKKTMDKNRHESC